MFIRCAYARDEAGRVPWGESFGETADRKKTVGEELENEAEKCAAPTGQRKRALADARTRGNEPWCTMGIYGRL